MTTEDQSQQLRNMQATQRVTFSARPPELGPYGEFPVEIDVAGATSTTQAVLWAVSRAVVETGYPREALRLVRVREVKAT